MSFTNSANMGLPIPAVGNEAGPDYAIDINACMTLIDQHTHAAGSGVKITPAGLDINADLTLNTHFLTNVAGISLSAQSVQPSINTIYESGVDLYFVDGSGNNVRLTQSGAVAGTPGSISNLVAPASASYVALSASFVWQSNANVAANMDAASYLLRNITPNSTFALTLSPPPALSADYTITMPLAPAVDSVLVMNSSGTISTQPATFLTPPGIISAYGGSSAPSGYLLCDGTAVSRTTYSALFSAIGEAYGAGDTTTTFNIPDLRGQFLRGVTGASGNDPDAASRTAMAAGGNTGNNVGSIQSGDIVSHTHLQSPHNHRILGGGGGAAATVGSNALAIAGFGTGGTYTNIIGGVGTAPIEATTAVNSNTGGNETRPINAYVNYIIKT